jgi:hypothetical protein
MGRDSKAPPAHGDYQVVGPSSVLAPRLDGKGFSFYREVLSRGNILPLVSMARDIYLEYVPNDSAGIQLEYHYRCALTTLLRQLQL